jgi:hypothetical protein
MICFRNTVRCILFAWLSCGCAGPRLQKALQEQTDSYVYAKPLSEVWPLAEQVLESHHFAGNPVGSPYHLETTLMTPEGEFPTAEPSGAGGAGQNPGAGGGRGGSRRGGPSRLADRSGGELVRFVVEGESVDADHCSVRIIRYTRDNMDTPEADGKRAVDMEWELISRAEPSRAARIREELKATGVLAP